MVSPSCYRIIILCLCLEQWFPNIIILRLGKFKATNLQNYFKCDFTMLKIMANELKK